MIFSLEVEKFKLLLYVKALVDTQALTYTCDCRELWTVSTSVMLGRRRSHGNSYPAKAGIFMPFKVDFHRDAHSDERQTYPNPGCIEDHLQEIAIPT